MGEDKHRETPVEKNRRRLKAFDRNVKQIKQATEMGREVGAERQKNLSELEKIKGKAREREVDKKHGKEE